MNFGKLLPIIGYLVGAATWYSHGYTNGRSKGYKEAWNEGKQWRSDWYHEGFKDGVKYEKLIFRRSYPECFETVEDFSNL